MKKSYFSPGAAFDLYVTAPENDGSGLQYERTICRGVCISQNAQMEWENSEERMEKIIQLYPGAL